MSTIRYSKVKQVVILIEEENRKTQIYFEDRKKSKGVRMSRPSSYEQPSKQCEMAIGPQMKRLRSNTNCHQCHKNDRGRVLQCNKCNKRYCIPCVNRWYPTIEEVLFAKSCPICRNICNCGACLQSKGPSKIQDLSITREEKSHSSTYILRVLLPSFKKYVEEAETQDNEVLQLLVRAEAIAILNEVTDGQQVSQTTCSCLTSDAGSENSLKAASREDGNQNYLYCPLAADTEKSDLQHFQVHFSEGQPVVVRNMLGALFRLSWEPTVLERALRISLRNGSNSTDVSVVNCLTWCEEKINIRNFFEGYSKGLFDHQGQPKILKLEWPSSDLFHEQLPHHYADLISSLPFKQYTHPVSGNLNIPVKLPRMPVLNLGPNMCVSYGPSHGVDQWDSIANLQYAVTDRVIILMHVAAISCPGEKGNKGKSPMSSNTLQGFEDPDAGTVWDIFRKQDVPKLEEYLSKHTEELRHSILPHQMVHPAHEQTVYLTPEHKRKLKDEYGIEPWTFVHKLGDAVFVPAGCFHQMRNLKSCVHVAVDFVSPESLSEGETLFEGRRSLPPDDFINEHKLQVKQLILHAIGQAVEDWEKIPWGLGGETPSLAFLTRKAKMMRLLLEREGHKLPPAKRATLEDDIQNYLNTLFNMQNIL